MKTYYLALTIIKPTEKWTDEWCEDDLIRSDNGVMVMVKLPIKCENWEKYFFAPTHAF